MVKHTNATMQVRIYQDNWIHMQLLSNKFIQIQKLIYLLMENTMKERGKGELKFG